MRLPRGNRRATPFVPSRPRFVVDIELADGAELVTRLREQGVAPDEVVFKYFWPRYAPPADAGVLSLLKSENLAGQFERLIAMHRLVPSGIPLPVGMVRNTDGEQVGYVIERVEGDTFQSLVELGLLDQARAAFAVVERTVTKLHAKSIAHGDLNPYNVIASFDGRTLLIDPVANPGSGTMLQDELSLAELKQLL
jgi:aminoglycoside phosphotransferase (APT) family kinase protein